jgi:uncharacterized protein DUF6962
MVLTEPMTMLTDYVLAVVSLAFSLLLFHAARARERRAVRLWAWGFLALSAAALVGGSFHGWAFYLGDAARRALWNATMLMIGAASALMIAGTALSRIALRDRSATWLLAGVALSLIGLAIQQSTFSFGESFNHNDIFHTIQIAALWFFYRGAGFLEDR